MVPEMSALRILVCNLERRGCMYIVPFSYETLVAYIDGFDHGVLTCDRTSELRHFVEWLNVRVGYHCSKHWAAVVRDVFAEGQTQLATRKFFELFKEYCDSTPPPPESS